MKCLRSPLAHAVLLMAPAIVPTSAMADWKPAGPIMLNIGFKAGGSADTQARMIGAELADRKGWKFIYKNVAGKGGASLARTLKDAPSDGLTLGMAVMSTFTYTPLKSKSAGFAVNDFDYLLTTARTQMGLVVRADSGWKNIDDVAKSVKSGRQLKFALMSPRLGDAATLVGKKFGIKFKTLKAKGGRGVLNGLMSKEFDIGFVAGIQVTAVTAGDLINVASAEKRRLPMSPNAPTFAELGLPYDFGSKFLLFAPKGVPDQVNSVITTAFAEVLSDPSSKSRKFITRVFGVPPLDRGESLNRQMLREIEANRRLLAKIQ